MHRCPLAILFDLDDTLISFEGVSDQAWQKCCGDFVDTHPVSVSKECLLRTLHAKRRWYWSDPQRHKAGRENIREARRGIVRLALADHGIADMDLANELANCYSEYHNELVCLFPNTIPTLGKLKSSGIRMGLITNGPSEGQRAKLRRFSLNNYFEIILIDQELGFGKPDVRVYQYALDLLHVSNDEVWMVGDNLIWDVQAPQSLGIHSIWHDYRKTGLPVDAVTIPDQMITDISQLLIGVSVP